jgi:CubicO group peptidase (beta-lactamase class C family)
MMSRDAIIRFMQRRALLLLFLACLLLLLSSVAFAPTGINVLEQQKSLFTKEKQLEQRGQTARSSAGQTPFVPDAYRQAKDQATKFGQGLLLGGAPGLQIAVAKEGQIVYSKAFGLADVDTQAPVTPETKFRIGSISKVLTAVAIVQLAEQGKLYLDAPIQRYLPSFPDKGATITSRMLAGHLGGIRHYEGAERTNQHHYASIVDGLKIFQNDPLAGPPGAQFNYSSYGFNILGAIVEAVTGESFNNHIQRNICRPLNLRSTTADQPNGLIAQRAQCYCAAPGKPPQVAPYIDNTYKLPSGGYLSTADDLVRLGSALIQPGFLRADSLEQLFTPQKTKAGQSTGYGMGWFVGKSRSGREIYWHSGGAAGGSSMLLIYPQSKVTIAMVANLSTAPFVLDDVERIGELFEMQAPK